MSGIRSSVSPLTDIQARLLAAIRRRVERGEPPPSYRDLCSQFGWRSTGTARDHLQALARKGCVELPRRRGGRVQVREGLAPVSNVPIIGRVTAGVPALAEQEIDGLLPIPAEWTRSGDYFALRVAGDSMSGAGIFEGDHVVIRAQSSANLGDVVAATVDGETTLKTLGRRGSRFLLVPDNPRYRAIEVKSESAVIHGVVVGLLRAYGTERASRRLRQPSRARCRERSRHAHRP
jgi:repressor LexA